MAEKRKRKGEKEGNGMIAGAWSHRNRRCSSNEAGQVLILVVLAIFVLIGTVALAVDVGFLRFMRRNMQKAADAGAIGGATEIVYHGDIQGGAWRDTSKNGFTHNEKGVIVTVNNPPLSGPHKDLPLADHYVEVIIEQDQPTFFARIFNITSAKVSARAVAYGGTDQGTQALGCIYALDPDASTAFHVGGENTTVEAECSIYVNSNNDNCALLITGNSTVQSTGISVVGESCIGGTSTVAEPPPEEGAPPVTDPLSYLTAPSGFSTSCPPERTNVNVHANMTLTPGVYCGGIRFTSSGLTVNFDPGLYILYGGGFDMHSGGASTLLGTDVTFYNTGSGTGGQTGYGAIQINAGANTELSATNHLAQSGVGSPASIPGVLFWQDPNNTKEATFNGQSDTIMEGALYFPQADVKWDGGNSTETGYAVVVAQQIKFTGGATFHITNESSGSGGTPGEDAVIPKVVLVE